MKIIADANIPFVKECFSSIGEVEVFPGRGITRDVVGEAECLLVRSVTKVDSDLLAGSKVRFVGTATIGFDHIDVENLSRNNIGFASAPGSNANSAAEYVIAGLLEIGRRYKINLEGKSIGVVGVGNVGSRVAKKCEAMEMKVLLNDPPLQRESGDAKYLPLEELYDCDFMTLHTPLTFEGIDKTFHLADEKFFKSLKAGCVFINASRGEVADTGALKASIRSGQLETTVLDVWGNEPNIDTELLEIVDIGTPHIAGYSLDGKIAGMIMIYETACKYFGLKIRYDIEDFLPKSSVPQLKINPNSGSEEDVLRGVVEKIYKISEDDTKLRQILNLPAEKRGSYFDDLRKNYPVRREFQNTKIEFTAEGGENLSKKLKGIGFQIKGEK
ncbi:MAG: 4-phosphoerythronate dehydrogenase [Sedimentisphaerales bacterium]|nr:4-phosphoerythronate dehydrogenase [Sedimentisphaerales bacterium]